MVVIVSGYFNPLHVGHIEYIEKAEKLGKELIIIVNNDKQVKLKGKPFMPELERVKIMSALKTNADIQLSIDEDRSVSKTLRFLHAIKWRDKIIFANGGDVKKNCREKQTCKELGIKCVYRLGKKIQSSSWLK